MKSLKHKKMKAVKVNTPKGKYLIPLKKVAEHRADYYAEFVDLKEKGGDEWKEEVDYIMDDDFEGIDWLVNNTNWEDWEDVAMKVSDDVSVTDEYFWTDSDNFEIIDVQN